eukprot:CAMPEP_0115043250 /NCGR_PEP_ID=MMETSP0216-20121206/46762_1 /TAXON_ID=223996 /ORGANISM="Protocruzia adherens, Strain Boccale" /LENGTH=382 /DNA_ID=CAMNT_0002425545 /DNA_START=17 /DNA_END=1165 /DNA_ORIENTATION=-
MVSIILRSITLALTILGLVRVSSCGGAETYRNISLNTLSRPYKTQNGLGVIAGSGPSRTILANVDSYIVEVNSKLNLEKTSLLITNKFCYFTEIVGTTFNCFTNLNVYQFEMDGNSFTYSKTLTFTPSSGSVDSYVVMEWIKASNGDYMAYGTGPNGLFLLSVASTLESINAMWIFGHKTFPIAIDLAEIEGLPGVFSVTGETIYGGGFIGFVNLSSSTPIDLDNFYSFPTPDSQLPYTASAQGGKIVLHTNDTLTLFQYNTEYKVYDHLWSTQLSSHMGLYSITAVQTQSDGDLLIYGLIFTSRSETGPLQLLEMDVSSGSISHSPDVNASHPNIYFQPQQQWSGPAPAEDTSSMSVVQSSDNPWNYVVATENLSEENISV